MLFDVLCSICVPFPIPRKDCAASQTQKPSVSKTFSDVCHKARFFISRPRQVLLMILVKKKSLVWDPRSIRDPSSSSSFWPHQSGATSRLGPDLVPPSRPVITEDEMSVQELETARDPFTHSSASETIPADAPVTSVEPEVSAQTIPLRRLTSKRPPKPVDRAEPPKRTRGDDDGDSAPLSAYHHDLEKVSENLKDGKSVFSGTGMPVMRDCAWLAIKTKARTPKSETLTEAQSVEPLQKDVNNLLVTVSFFAGRRVNTTYLQQSRSRDNIQCHGQTATGRSENVDAVS